MDKDREVIARIRGGVCFSVEGWRVFVDVWRDYSPSVRPKRFVSNQTFETEALALAHYHEKIRPGVIDGTIDKAEKVGARIQRLLDGRTP